MHSKYLLTFIFSVFFLAILPAQWQPSGLDLLPDTQRVASISVLSEEVVWGISYYDRTPAPAPRVVNTSGSSYYKRCTLNTHMCIILCLRFHVHNIAM